MREIKNEFLDMPFQREKRPKSVRIEALERRQELMNLAEKIGLRNLRNQTKVWTNHYKVSERSINRDFNWIKGHWRPKDLGESNITLGIARDQALNQALQILATSMNNDEKLRAIMVLINVSKHYREELEAWGMKEKQMNNESSTIGTTFNLIEKSIDDIKNERIESKQGLRSDSERSEQRIKQAAKIIKLFSA